MGKAQSKRSVDITTDVKKDDVLEEGTGKMGKIEDVDQLKPQINGDTHHNENEGNEKEKLGDGEATENEKDLSTEKEQQSKIQQATDSGAGGDDANNATAEAEAAVENGNDDTLSENKTTPAAAAAAAESSTTTGTNAETTNGDSNKKTKKEKLKKKWSFRSISFGKKDKQKPSKKDEETVNGECEKVPEENTEEAAKSAEQITNNTIDNAEAAVPAAESVNAEEKTPEPTPAVNGTESESDNKSPTTDKSSEIVPPATETKDEQPPQQQQQQQSTAKTPEPASTEASVILNGADKISPSPAKIEEQSIPPTTSSVAVAEVVSLEQTSTEVPTTVASTESSESMEVKPKQETEASQQEISATTAIPQNLPEEKPTEQAVSKEEEQKQQTENTDVENKSDVKEWIEIVPPVSAEVQKVEEKTQIEEQKPEPVEQVEVMPVIEKTEEIIEVVKPSENTEPTSVETSPIASQEVPAKEEKPVEMPVNDDLKTETAEVDPKSEGDINPEQIAQTIALIDEITQEALASSQQQNSSEQNAQEGNVEQKEIPSNDAADDSTPPCNASPLEGNSSVPKDPETTSSATIDSQIPLATPSPVVELGSEQNIIDNENKTEQKAAAAVESPETVVATDATVAAAAAATATIQSDEKSVINDTQEVVTKVPESNAEQAQPEQQQTEETISNTNVVDPAAITTEHVPNEEEKLVPNDAEPITQNNDENAKEAAATADTLKTTDTSKENGIGEDHEVTETSATESLNGQVEQKTAEEIKSEQKSSDIKVEVAPEVAPVAAE